jgi:hypothetical protein
LVMPEMRQKESCTPASGLDSNAGGVALHSPGLGTVVRSTLPGLRPRLF